MFIYIFIYIYIYLYIFIYIYIYLYTGGPYCTNILWAWFIRSMRLRMSFFFLRIIIRSIHTTNIYSCPIYRIDIRISVIVFKRAFHHIYIFIIKFPFTNVVVRQYYAIP